MESNDELDEATLPQPKTKVTMISHGRERKLVVHLPEATILHLVEHGKPIHCYTTGGDPAVLNTSMCELVIACDQRKIRERKERGERNGRLGPKVVGDGGPETLAMQLAIEQGKSVMWMAERVGCDRAVMSKYLHGRRKPCMSRRRDIARALEYEGDLYELFALPVHEDSDD